MEKRMNIMIFDLPAEHGGALTILEDVYHDIKNHGDKTINWFFVLSKPVFEETENIKILRFPWVKKSWGHRLYFDQIIAPQLVKKYRVDKVLSLQNVKIPRINCSQTVYVHQSLPFVDYKFSIKENKKFWIYQNIIGSNIIHSIKNANHVIVQTDWMKNACIEKTKVQRNKIEVIPPKFNMEITNYFTPNKKTLSTFFYPANGSSYKNHKIIIDACIHLKSLNITNYEIIFTLKGNENNSIENLSKLSKKENLPIRFVGHLKKEEVFNLYAKSILLFPSYIETVGLPLIEARFHKGIIFAANTNFAKEVLRDYENANFFDTFNSMELSKLMYQSIQGNSQYNASPDKQLKRNETKQLITVLINE